MTGRRVAWLLGLGAAVLFLIYYTAYLSVFVLLFLLAVPACSLLLFLPARQKAAYRLRAQAGTVDRGGTCVFWLELVCGSRLPLGPVRVDWRCEDRLTGEQFRRKAVFPARCGRQRLRLSAVAPHCGRVICTVRRARVCDVLGLFSAPCREAGGKEAGVLVLPPMQPPERPARALPVSEGEGPAYDPHRPGQDRSEPFGLREYRPGDSLHSVHWKLAEKRDVWMVRQGSLPLPAGPDIVVEFPRAAPQALDCAAQTALLLSAALTRAGTPHRMLWYDHGLQTAPVGDADTLAEAAGGLLSASPQEAPLAAASLEQTGRPVLYVTAGSPAGALLPDGTVAFACGAERVRESGDVVSVRPGNEAAALEALGW